MLRFNYQEQENGQILVTIVSERDNVHSLAGRLVLEKEEWELIWTSLAIHSIDNDCPIKFENKEEKDRCTYT